MAGSGIVIEVLAVNEVEAKDGSVGETPVVDRLSRTYDLVSERNQIAYRRTRADVLQVRPAWSPPATFGILGHLGFSVFESGIEGIHLPFIGKVRSDSGINSGYWSPSPIGEFLFEGSEACYEAGTIDAVNAVY